MPTTDLSQIIFEQLFDENRELLTRLACSMVRDEETAKDIVSETFTTLWSKRDSIPVGKVLPYSYSAVRNSCLNYRRDAARHSDSMERIRQKEQSAMDQYTCLLESTDPSELFSSEIMDIYRKTLSRLPRRTLEVWLKSREEGLTYREIADALGIGEKRVEKHMHLALTRLRAALGDYLSVLLWV